MKSTDSALVGYPTGSANGIYLVGDFDVVLAELGVRVLKADVDENEWRYFDWCDPWANEPTPSCPHSCAVHAPVMPKESGAR